jgi:hypothetical protein
MEFYVSRCTFCYLKEFYVSRCTVCYLKEFYVSSLFFLLINEKSLIIPHAEDNDAVLGVFGIAVGMSW